jgi:hypothetical protein
MLPFAPDPLIRIPIYIAVGIITEVLFTSLADLINPNFLSSWNAKQEATNQNHSGKRDTRAVGYTFLWMLPIYSLMICLEPLSELIKNWHWVLRGFFYLGIVWFTEYCGGWIIKKISGRCPWDYSYSKYSFHGFIRWDFAPFWFGYGLFVEWFAGKLVLLTPTLKQIFF